MAKKNETPEEHLKVDHRIERDGNVVNIYINFGAGGSAGGSGTPDNKTTGSGKPDNKTTGSGKVEEE